MSPACDRLKAWRKEASRTPAIRGSIAALERIRRKFTDLEDAMLVQAYLEKDLAAHGKEFAHRLAALISGLEAEGAERRAKDAVLDARVDKLVRAIGEVIQRMPPTALSQ